MTLSALNAADTVVYAATATSDGIDGVDGARRTVAQFRRHRQQLGAPDTLTEAGIVVGGVKETIMSRAAVASLGEGVRGAELLAVAAELGDRAPGPVHPVDAIAGGGGGVDHSVRRVQRGPSQMSMGSRGRAGFSRAVL